MSDFNGSPKSSPVLVDSNVLLDVITLDPVWGDWASSTLKAIANEAQLVINAVIYAEVSVRFTRIEDLDQALPIALFRREPLPFAAGFLAGKAFLEYRRRGGTRTSTLPDFLIGAHASIAGFRLLSRDVARYRTYFPGLELMSPDQG